MCRALNRRGHRVRINAEWYEFATYLRQQFASNLEILRRKNGQDISLTQQVPVHPTPRRRKPVPSIEQPDALRDQPGSALAAPALPQRQYCKMLQLGVGPHHVSGEKRLSIAPRMHQVTSQQSAHASTRELNEPVF